MLKTRIILTVIVVCTTWMTTYGAERVSPELLEKMSADIQKVTAHPPAYYLPATSICAIAENINIDNQHTLARTTKKLQRVIKTTGIDTCPGFFGWTPLMATAEHGTANLVQEILTYQPANGVSVDVNRKSVPFGRTALMQTAANCTKNASAPTIASMLLAAGADPAIRDAQGKTADDLINELFDTFGKENLPLKSFASCTLVKNVINSAVASVS